MIGTRLLTSSDIVQLDTAKQETYGAVGVSADGRVYRYCKFGGTSTINPGLVLVGPAAPANSTALAITATGTGNQVAGNLLAGSTQLVVTNGATAVTADQFADGFLEIMVGGTLPIYSLRINGNTAAAASTGYVTLSLVDPLPTAATTLVPGTDTVNLVYNKYNGPIASLTGNAPAGVTITNVVNTASVTNYGWIQTGGHAMVKATTATLGLGIAPDEAGTAGYVIISAATTGNIGYAKASSASGNASVELNIV